MKLSILLVMPSSAINFPLSSQAIRYLLYLVYHRCHKVEMIFQQIYIIYTCIFCQDSGFSRHHSLRHSLTRRSPKRQHGFGGRVQPGMGVNVPKSSGKFVLKCWTKCVILEENLSKWNMFLNIFLKKIEVLECSYY